MKRAKKVPGLWDDLMVLTKVRLSLLVLMTTFVGFFLGTEGSFDWLLFIRTFIGTSCAAFGAAVLNQFFETDTDALMKRTQHRPLPAGRRSPRFALALGSGLSVVGSLYLGLQVNWLTSFLGILTLVTYLFLYTPLKRKTYLCTYVGAIPGAIPPMLGWTAVRGDLDAPAWVLFGILLLWQMPHFFALAWLYREDFERAGLPMLPVVDKKGVKLGATVLFFNILLMWLTTMPTAIGLTGTLYMNSALLLGSLFLAAGIWFSFEKNPLSARVLFFASILYLPALLTMMVVNKI